MWNNSIDTPLGVSRLSLINPKNNKKYSVEFITVLSTNRPEYRRTDGIIEVYNTDLGTLPGEVHLKIKDDVIPVVMLDRHTPISLRSKFKEEGNQLEALEVIAKVKEPTPWVSQTVIVHKKSGKLRICIDQRELNKALVCERFTLPILEDKLHELSQSISKISKADLGSGYWHFKLDSDSSTTFQSCHGRYRWFRLPFGTSVSAEIFQRKLLEAQEGFQVVSVLLTM